MGYIFLGNYFADDQVNSVPKKSPDEVIKAAKKQKLTEKAVETATSPIKSLVKKAVKTTIVGEKGETVSEEQFIKAIILRELRDRGILPIKKLDARIDERINLALKKIQEKHQSKNPLWRPLYRG